MKSARGVAAAGGVFAGPGLLLFRRACFPRARSGRPGGGQADVEALVTLHDQGDDQPLDHVLPPRRHPGQTAPQPFAQLLLRQRAVGQVPLRRRSGPVGPQQRTQQQPCTRRITPPRLGECPPLLGDRVLAPAGLDQLHVREEGHAVSDGGRAHTDMPGQGSALHRGVSGVEVGEGEEDVDLLGGPGPVTGQGTARWRGVRALPTGGFHFPGCGGPGLPAGLAAFQLVLEFGWENKDTSSPFPGPRGRIHSGLSRARQKTLTIRVMREPSKARVPVPPIGRQPRRHSRVFGYVRFPRAASATHHRLHWTRAPCRPRTRPGPGGPT